MRWFRLYDDVINDPKVIKMPEALRWHWIALLCISSKNEGSLPMLDDVAIQLRVTAAKATEIIAALVKGGLLDKTETGFTPHNWNGRQYKVDIIDPTAATRMKRYREKHRNATVTDRNATVTVKRPDTETETDTDNRAEKERLEGARKRGARLPDGWEPNENDWQEAKSKLTDAGSAFELSKFRDYWKAQSGQRGVKLDWDATFRNWIRNAKGSSGPIAKPLTEFQRKQQETNDVRAELRNFANGLGSGGTIARILPDNQRERPEGVRSGASSTFLAIPGAPSRRGH